MRKSLHYKVIFMDGTSIGGFAESINLVSENGHNEVVVNRGTDREKTFGSDCAAQKFLSNVLTTFHQEK